MMPAMSDMSERTDLSKIQGLVFDCDGVLFDSRDLNARYYNHVRQALGLPDMNAEEEEYSFMHTVDAAFQRIIPAHLHPQIKAVQAGMNYQEFIACMTPEPGLLALLMALEGRGMRMAINTNRSTSMEQVLEQFQMTRFFDPVVTAAKVLRPKPDPEGLHCILRVWDMDAAQIAFLGDSALDQEAAKGAGTPFWAYRNRNLQADLHVDSFHELRQWFDAGFFEAAR